MSPEDMLANLAEHGSDAASDFNDGLNGWFGWDVTEVRNAVTHETILHRLTVTFQEPDGSKTEESWTLMPVRTPR